MTKAFCFSILTGPGTRGSEKICTNALFLPILGWDEKSLHVTVVRQTKNHGHM